MSTTYLKSGQEILSQTINGLRLLGLSTLMRMSYLFLSLTFVVYYKLPLPQDVYVQVGTNNVGTFHYVLDCLLQSLQNNMPQLVLAIIFTGLVIPLMYKMLQKNN